MLNLICLILSLFAYSSNAFCCIQKKYSTLTGSSADSRHFRQRTSESLIGFAVPSSRRDVIEAAVSISLASLGWLALPFEVSAASTTGPADGNLPELPPEAVRSYLQYRIPLQLSADYYVFELQDKIKNPDEWGAIAELFQANNNRGQGQPSRIEREYVNPMRILGLSMPPEIAERMQDTQYKFERAMAGVSKATAGVRRDLPVELDKNALSVALAGWEDGRQALNEFFATLNESTGLPEMKTIPPAGPNQVSEYGRSPKRYFELMKKTKLCQNRGGPTLSQAWGQLMVSGYLENSCGIPDLDGYFYQ